MKNVQDHLDQFSGKNVIVRCNFDVPIEAGVVQDTTRIEDSVSTIRALLSVNAKLVLLAHYDRPDGKPDPEKSLKPVVPILENLLGNSVTFIDYVADYHQLSINPENKISLIENLRFWSQEEDNDPDFALSLSKLGDAYVNQALANCHRAHASIVGIPKHLPSYAGLNLSKEMQIMDKVRNNPDKPLVVVIGGAKLETKEPLVTAFADSADYILVGGKIAVDMQEKGNVLPNVKLAELSENSRDITSESANSFAEIIRNAKTVVWNGTMGVFEEPENQVGTRIIAQAVNECAAFTVVGGGDTETALTELNMESGIDYISSGGGAMLTFLSEGKLVGIQALEG